MAIKNYKCCVWNDEEKKGEGKEGEKKEEVSKEEKKEEKKEEEENIEIVLKVDMHCEACARKVTRSLKGFQGFRRKVAERLTSFHLFPSPLLREAKQEIKEPPKEEKKDEPPPVATVVLKVQMHCEACAQVLQKRIKKIKGVESVTTELGSNEVRVKGVVDPEKLARGVYKKTGKQASIVKEEEKKEDQEKKEGEKKGGEKKEGEEGKGEEDEKKMETEMKKNEFMPPKYYLDYAYPPPQIFSDENPHACTLISLDPEVNKGITMDPSALLFNQLKTAEPFFLLAGPNVIESEDHILYMAKHLKAMTSKLGLKFVFKSSFDKANRTSSKSFRGPGLAEGLKILERVKTTYDVPIVTDVHESIQCEAVGKVADIIQIPAFLCRQTDLLVAAAKTGKIINIKKGQFCASSVMLNSAEKVRLAGNQNVMVCERGTMFGYNDLIVDPRNLEWMREANCPVVADITHSLQQPAGKKLDGGGVASGGLRELIPCIARTAVAVGVDGLFMEVHNDPLNAPVDGPTQWPLRHLEELLEELIAIGVSHCSLGIQIKL
nr:2-dehydro-3-deoxyphosphooctonate aldolase 1 [Ipomoea batatas]